MKSGELYTIVDPCWDGGHYRKNEITVEYPSEKMIEKNLNKMDAWQENYVRYIFDKSYLHSRRETNKKVILTFRGHVYALLTNGSVCYSHTSQTENSHTKYLIINGPRKGQYDAALDYPQNSEYILMNRGSNRNKNFPKALWVYIPEVNDLGKL